MSWHTFSRWTGHNYRFPDFRLDVYYGSHNALTGIGFDNYTFTEKLFGIKGTEALDQYGSLFNTNFMLTLPNGYKVGSVAGIDNLNQAEAWRNNQPNLLLHQRMVYTKPEDYAQEVIELGGAAGGPSGAAQGAAHHHHRRGALRRAGAVQGAGDAGI